MRHSTAEMTLRTYGRDREDLLVGLTEAVGNMVRPAENHALFMHKEAAGAEGMDVRPSNDKALQLIRNGAEERTRTSTRLDRTRS